MNACPPAPRLRSTELVTQRSFQTNRLQPPLVWHRSEPAPPADLPSHPVSPPSPQCNLILVRPFSLLCSPTQGPPPFCKDAASQPLWGTDLSQPRTRHSGGRCCQCAWGEQGWCCHQRAGLQGKRRRGRRRGEMCVDGEDGLRHRLEHTSLRGSPEGPKTCTTVSISPTLSLCPSTPHPPTNSTPRPQSPAEISLLIGSIP